MVSSLSAKYMKTIKMLQHKCVIQLFNVAVGHNIELFKKTSRNPKEEASERRHHGGGIMEEAPGRHHGAGICEGGAPKLKQNTTHRDYGTKNGSFRAQKRSKTDGN